jgi:hypothetical protein
MAGKAARSRGVRDVPRTVWKPTKTAVPGRVRARRAADLARRADCKRASLEALLRTTTNRLRTGELAPLADVPEADPAV